MSASNDNIQDLRERKKLFQELELLPFLSHNTVVNILSTKTEALLLQFCELYKYDYEKVHDTRGDEYKRMQSYLNNLKYLHIKTKSRKTKKIKTDPLATATHNIKLLANRLRHQDKSVKETKSILKQAISTQENNTPEQDLPIIAKAENSNMPNSNIQNDIEIKIKNDKRIKSVKYSSLVTKNSIETISLQSQLMAEYFEDYNYYQQGGRDEIATVFVETKQNDETIIIEKKRKRHIFPSIILAEQIQTEFKAMLSSSINGEPVLIENKKIKEYQTNLKFHRTIENQALYTIGAMAENSFNIAKSLNGFIINDKAFVDNGIVSLNKENETDIQSTESTIKDLIKYTDNENFQKVLETIKDIKD